MAVFSGVCEVFHRRGLTLSLEEFYRCKHPISRFYQDHGIPVKGEVDQRLNHQYFLEGIERFRQDYGYDGYYFPPINPDAYEVLSWLPREYWVGIMSRGRGSPREVTDLHALLERKGLSAAFHAVLPGLTTIVHAPARFIDTIRKTSGGVGIKEHEIMMLTHCPFDIEELTNSSVYKVGVVRERIGIERVFEEKGANDWIWNLTLLPSVLERALPAVPQEKVS